MTKIDTHKKAMIEALEKSLGVVTDACKTVGVCRQSHYDWYKEDENYRKQVDEIANVSIDYAESELYKKIAKGDTTAIIFFLKTRGKQRGYIEKSEIDHTVNIPTLPDIIIK